MRSRYPVDLRDGFGADFEHLAQLRQLAREMRLDSWYWATQGDFEKALDNLLSIHTIADSLYEEPALMSVLVGHAISGITRAGVEYLLNDTELTESQLAQLQMEIQAQEGQYDGAHKNAVIGERVMIMSISDFVAYSFNSKRSRAHYTSVIPMTSLTMPIAAERIVLGVEFQKALDRPSKTFEDISTHQEQSDERYSRLWFVAPMASLGDPGYLNANYGSTRVYLYLTVTGIALERYRLKKGSCRNRLTTWYRTFSTQFHATTMPKTKRSFNTVNATIPGS